ncbi:MAG: FRG domain-containing protein [Oscillospiraceae bacterium]|nr:FRG domain-containing protein [Oscillospiraceae bacterium]
MEVKFYGIELIKNETTYSTSGNLMWGNFEYVSFKNIKEFTNEYEIKSRNSNNVIYMYSFKDDLKIDLCQSDGCNCSEFKDIKSGKKYNFVGLTLVSVDELTKKNIFSSYDIESTFGVRTLCEYLDQTKENRLKRFNNLVYESFGTLNGDDLCFVTLFDDIGDYIDFIEELHVLEYSDIDNKKTNFFDATYSFVSSPYLSHNTELFSKCHGFAAIQITYNFKQPSEYIVGTILNELKILNDNNEINDDFKNDIQVCTSLGEYDIVIHLPINKLNTNLYLNILNPCNKDFYMPNIEQCHTRFYKKFPTNNVYNCTSIESNYKLSINDDIDNIFKDNIYKIEDALERYDSSTVLNLKLIYNTLSCDFKKTLCIIQQNDIMYDDIKMQYNSIINISCNLLKDYSEKTNHVDIYNFALDLIHIFKQTVYRVKQTNLFEKLSAQSLFRDVAVYDKMISCYYYIVKTILLYVYKFGNKNQSRLTPFISFEAVPKVTSELIQVPMNPTEKILSIRLPQEAYYKTHKYIPLLFHELGHYINPKNRKMRNMYLFVIISVVSLQEYIVCNEQSIDKDDLLNNLIEKFIIALTTYPDNSKEYQNYYQMFEINYPDMFSSTWDVFCNFLTQIMKEVLTNRKTNKISKYNDIIDFIRNFFHLFTDEYFGIGNFKAFDDYDSKCKHWETTNAYLKSVLMGLREALADTFMMLQVGMNLSEYIALTVSVRIDSIVNFEDDSELSKIRLGCIYMFTLCGDINDTDHNTYGVEKNLMYDKIINICHNLSQANNDVISKHLETIKQSIQEYQNAWWPMYRLFYKLLATVTFEDVSNGNKSFDSFFTLLRMKNKLIPDEKNYISWINFSINQPSLLYLYEQKEEINNSEREPEICDYSKLNDCYKNYNKSIKKNTIIPEIPTYTVNNLDYLISALQVVNDVLGGHNDLWYRGHASTQWDLKPNLFRSLEISGKDDTQKITQSVSKLISEYNDFVASSAESIELTGNIRTEADWLAYMQHYFVGTNLLDWSEQPLTALYFALENYFVNPCKHDDAKLGNCSLVKKNFYKDDMVIWVLNPNRMNDLFYNSIIPNLSIKENADANRRFLLTYNESVVGKNCKEGCIIKHLPMAITTSRISNHIQAQKGHFVAYDIHYKVDQEVNYISNDDIVEIYNNISDLKECHQTFFKISKHPYKPFLAKIIIPYHLKESTANYVKQMGVSLSTIYPELANIGIDISKKYSK